MHVPKKTYNLIIIKGILLFIFTYYLLAPFIHELAHITLLKINGCTYWVDYDFSFLTGLTTHIYLLSCEISKKTATAILLSGIASTTLIGITLVNIDLFFIRRKIISYSTLFTFTALGFFASTLAVFISGEGDIVNISSWYENSPTELRLNVIILLITAYIFIYMIHTIKTIKKR